MGMKGRVKGRGTIDSKRSSHSGKVQYVIQDVR